MKAIGRFLTRLCSNCKPKQSKAGASLVLVVIIGAALAVWVLGILPMMMGTGTTAISLLASQNDYLSSRSSMEFCKSELEKIVETEPPYTFAVVDMGDLDNSKVSQYAAVPKYVFSNAGNITNSVDSTYASYVSYSSGSDNDDVPANSANGNKVRAICSVTPDPEDAAKYNIVIATYRNGDHIMSYTASYTLFGSLKINPEAYKQVDALPLDDYILVDGIMGGKFNESGALINAPNVIWNSNITFKSDIDDYGTFNEWLLPIADDKEHANAGAYTAMFKMTAEAAQSEDATTGDPILTKPLTGEGENAVKGAIKPVAVANEAAATKNGDTWIEVSGSSVTVKMLLNGASVRLSNDQRSIFYNGSATNPSMSGTYAVTVDIPAFTKDELQILAVPGLYHSQWPTASVSSLSRATLSAKIEFNTTDPSNIKFSVKVDGNTVSSGLKIAFTNNPSVSSASQIDWKDYSSSVEYKVSDFTGTTYVYVRQVGHFTDNGRFCPASNVAYADSFAPFKHTTTPQSGQQYMIIAPLTDYQWNGKDMISITNNYLLTISNNNLSGALLSEENFIGSLGSGVVLQGTSPWTFESTGNNQWTIKRDGKYLTITSNGATLKNSPETGSYFTIAENGALFARYSMNSYQTRYLRISKSNNNSITVSSSSRTSQAFNLIGVPTNGSTDVSSSVSNVSYSNTNTITYGSYTYQQLWNNVKTATGKTPTDLRLNGIPAAENSTEQIPAGTYNLVGKFGDHYVSMGTLTINQAVASGLSLAPSSVTGDNLAVTISTADWSGDDTQVKYFGYAVESNNAWSDFLWFTAATSTYEFRLPVGNYKFAVAEHISGNFTPQYAESDPYTIQWADIPAPSTNEFVYKVVPNGANPIVTWYKLPDNVTPDRLTMVYGIYDTLGTTDTADDTIDWNLTYPMQVDETESVIYGVLIEGTMYKQLDNGELVVYQLSSPQQRTNVGGHQSSGIAASSLYFMGQSVKDNNNTKYSLMSYGNDIHLTADLIVFKFAPNGSYTDAQGNTTTGEIIVQPTETSKTGKVLIFSATAFGPFEAGQFYIVNAGTDLLNPQDGAYTKVVGKSGGNKVTVSNGTFTELEFSKAAETLFRKGEYPEPDLNILFATQRQLLAIISSEKIGWTQNGVLSGSDKSGNSYSNSTIKRNAQYAVCTYINRVDGAVSRVANRVFLVGKDSPTTNNLTFNSNSEFCTRYLCIDAKQLEGNNAYLKIYNLTEDTNIIEWFSELLNVTKYISKTLQLEYEQATTVYYNGSNLRSETAKVGRCDNGLDLFSAAAANQDLLVDYTISDIESWFGDWTSSVQSVERYLSIDGTSSDKTINIGSFIGTNWKIFANYVYFGSNVNNIYVDLGASGLSRFDLLTFNSQEYGYTEEDYLGFFRRNSEESYAGTIVYFDQTTTINVKYSKYNYVEIFGVTVPIYAGTATKTYYIDQGFYYVYASDNNTRILDLTNGSEGNLASGPNNQNRPYKIPPESLAAYTVYINPNDGTLSNAYVEPGIYGSDSSALGGFSGGNVE